MSDVGSRVWTTMKTDDEVLYSHRRLDGGERQLDLVSSYCSGIENEIRTAPSRADAETIIRNICGYFERECSSVIVRNALGEYIGELFRRYWG